MTATTRTALARLHRPRRFRDMATQEHVSETLQAAVARGRVAHAYLFCGPRGVGKTTAARLLAMALNCPERSEDGEPCGTCDSCERIWSGKTSLDVVEIDAASNRGVDDARDLRERAMYAPTDERRFKVYIIDEAHMLTREAWNALLKILEEPPPRVIFVFATTEPQKIQQAAPPILSRCQRFDFRRIGTHAIVARLRQVLAEEGVPVSEDALLPIARRAEGGMRDALSLLDQVLSLAHGGLTAEDVTRVLGLVGEELYLELFSILASRRHGDVFRFVERLLDDGYDLAEFQKGLADALRRLLIVKLDGVEAVEVREDLRSVYFERASGFAVGDLLRMLSQVGELDTEGRFRKSGNPRLLLEVLLLRFAHLERTVELEELLLGTAAATAGQGQGQGHGQGRTRTRTGARGGEEEGGASAVSLSGGERSVPGARELPSRSVAHGSAPADGLPEGDSSAPARGGRGNAELALRHAVEKAPAGLGFFLRAARVATESEAEVVVEIPPGPGLDRLTTDAAAHRAVRDALVAGLGREVELTVRPLGAASGGGSAAASAPPPRITPERLRAERLEKIAESAPTLGLAMKSWDLELLD